MVGNHLKSAKAEGSLTATPTGGAGTKVTCKFKFKNTGDGPLVIHQAIASCGCTVPQYPKEPIKPGESGEVTVTYNGAGKFPGHFRKTITLRTNSKNEITRLVVEGDMTPASADINQ